MYTKNQAGGRTQETRTSMTSTAAFSGGKERYGDNGLPILIPKDYRGELLRQRQMQQPAPTPKSETQMERETDAEQQTAVHSEPIPAEENRADENHDPAARETGSILAGLYHLLVGESGEEEETLLLLAIGLLLLWGHLDRGGLFDASTWDSDDLALLLIGYLLIS